MTPEPARDSRGSARIAVVRALDGLGDMLCAVPALSALRRAYPRADVALIALPGCAWLLKRFRALVDALIPFPGYPGMPEVPFEQEALDRFLARARSSRCDLAIQMHGSGVVSNAFTAMLGARRTVGLYEPSRRPPTGGAFFPYPARGSEIRRCMFLMRSIGCRADDRYPRFPVRESDRLALRSHPLLGRLGDEQLVCLHPGARDPARRWPPARFAQVGDALAGRGYRIVLTGTSAERATADAVCNAMRRAAVNVAGTTALGTLAALLERTSLLITNDTGLSHLAASLGTPSVIVFLSSDPDRWAPLDRSRHRPVVAGALADRSECTMRISAREVPAPGEVLDEAVPLLHGHEG